MMVQLTSVLWVLTCTSARTGLRGIPSLSLLKAVSDGFSDIVAVYGAVLCFVELHCDAHMSPGDCGASPRSAQVFILGSTPRRFATTGDRVDGAVFGAVHSLHYFVHACSDVDKHIV